MMQGVLAWLGLTMMVVGAAAQTTVTTSGGTTNSVPVFTSSATVGNAPISVSGSNVGIGTTNPTSALTLNAGGANYNPSTMYGLAAAWALQSAGVELAAGVDSSTPYAYWLQTRQGSQNQAWPIALNPVGGNVGIGTANPTSVFTVSTGGANYNPSTTYGSAAAWALQSSGVELAAGVDSSTPYAYWLQARQGSQNQAWPIALNPVGGNVGIGTTAPGAKLEVNGNVKLTSGSGASVTYADGSVQTTAWNGVLNGGDYAEDMRAMGNKKKYEPGDVLVLASDESEDVQKSAEPYSTLVAGIFATKPGVVGRREEVAESNQTIPMAMVGVVPTKVTAENGPIHKGDLLVTSSAAGYAMKGTDHSRMLGAVLGKAMGSLDSGTGVIEVLVTLQ